MILSSQTSPIDLLKFSQKSNPSNDFPISLNTAFTKSVRDQNPNCPQLIRWDKVKFTILQNMTFSKNSKQLTKKCFSKKR